MFVKRRRNELAGPFLAPAERSGEDGRLKTVVRAALVSVAVVGGVVCIFGVRGWRPRQGSSGTSVDSSGGSDDQPHPGVGVDTMFVRSLPPHDKTLGVNLGGWLCLEDWLFSEKEGVSVGPKFGSDGQGTSLPPTATPIRSFTGTSKWPSEGILAQRMNSTIGPKDTARAFIDHRNSFIKDADFKEMVSLGIRAVRVPLTWAAFADALSPLSDVYMNSNAQTTLVPDPVYVDDVTMVTIPRAWLADRIREAGAAGLRVVLDLHAFPGGAQDGTYNSVWPLPPRFWNSRSKIGNVSMTEVGLWIVQAFVKWVDEELDANAKGAIHSLQLMNEPAHMNWVDPAQRAAHPFAGFANESAVLSWLVSAASVFRESGLPQYGIKVFVQLIETAFEDFFGVVPNWFRNTFSPEERASWVVLGRQYYPAFAQNCTGTMDAGSGYSCTEPTNSSRSVIKKCVRTFVNLTNHYFDTPQIAVVEFSLGTSNDPAQACSQRGVLSTFWQEQLHAFSQGTAEFYFWTWKTPHGNCFEPGWSLQHFAKVMPLRECWAILAREQGLSKRVSK